MLKKLAKKEIKFAHGLGIVIIAALLASTVVGLNVSFTLNYVKALSLSSMLGSSALTQSFGSMVGLEILTPPVKCSITNPYTEDCLGVCQACGNITGACAGFFEVKARFLSGSMNPLWPYGAPVMQALCLANPLPPNGGSFYTGSRCIGQVSGVLPPGPHILKNFGCYRLR